MPEVKIENPEEWLSQHDKVHIEGMGEFEILTANKHGVLHVGDENRPHTIEIDDPDVTVL